MSRVIVLVARPGLPTVTEGRSGLGTLGCEDKGKRRRCIANKLPAPARLSQMGSFCRADPAAETNVSISAGKQRAPI